MSAIFDTEPEENTKVNINSIKRGSPSVGGDFEAEKHPLLLSKPEPTEDEPKTHLSGSVRVRKTGLLVDQAGEGKKGLKNKKCF